MRVVRVSGDCGDSMRSGVRSDGVRRRRRRRACLCDGGDGWRSDGDDYWIHAVVTV